MALQTPAHPRTAGQKELALPPPYTQVRLREMGDAFAHATSIAAEQGAGTLVYVGRFDLAEFAVVLEPEEPLAQARRGFYACMAALTDALIAHAEPETYVVIGWPDAISVNGGVVGGGRLAWPETTAEDEVPDWMVFGAMIRTASLTGVEPGLNPHVTALAEEGFSEFTPDRLMESFARNLMVSLDAWHESGFGVVAKTYLERLPRENGVRRSIDDNGDLLVGRVIKPKPKRFALLPQLKTPSWFDPVTKAPCT
jgi:biotin-(acetyl-CoA carboxylase) ligase